MFERMLKTSVVLAILSVVLLIGAILLTNWRFPRQSNGELVFASTYQDGTKLDKIVLTGPDGTTTLQKEGGYWVVKEADYYYASTELLNRLLTDFNNSTYYGEVPFSLEQLKEKHLDETGIQIATFQQDKLLNSITIGKAAEKESYYFAKPRGKEEIWLIDGKYNLPKEFYSWIMQPVSELPPEMVEQIEVSGKIARRDNPTQPFFVDNGIISQAKALTDAAAYVLAENVLSAQNFDENTYPQQKTIKFTTFQGLIIEFHLYSDDKSYWLKITLSTTPLPKRSVNAYIEDNQIFYDGWYFKIPNEQGKLLSLISI